MAETQKVIAKTGMPKSVPYIIGNEAAERFSFYAIRAIMSTFLVSHFFNPSNNPALQAIGEAKANELAHMFAFVAYFTPLIGGILADWFFGKYKVILYISILYACGNIVVALSTGNLTFFTIGLMIIACAAGGIKSCVSANVGDQFDKSNEHLLSKMYGWFYFTINTGSSFALLVIPVVYNTYGAELAFAIPGALMIIATIVFWMGRKRYVRVAPSGPKRENFLTVSWWAIQQSFKKKNGQPFWERLSAEKKVSEKAIDGVRAVYRILMVFAFTPLFWALWDQNLSEWVLQATKLDRHLFGYEIFPEQIQLSNTLFLIALIPVFNYGIYPFIEKLGIKTTPLRRIGAGLFLTGIAFVIVALIQENIDAGGKPTVWWQVLAYLILAAAEILVSVTCLEYAYTHSPKSMKSTMSALYLLGISLGNLIDGLVNNSIANKGFFGQFTGAKYYWLFIGIITVFFILFLLVSKRLPEKRYVGEE